MEASMILDDGDIKITRYESNIRILVEVDSLKKRRVTGGNGVVHVAEVKIEVEDGKVSESEREDEEGGGRDPMERVGEDMMRKIMENLDARSLARALMVSRSWFTLASSDSLWSPLCEKLCAGKAHIPRWSKVPGLSKLASYSRAVTDSKRARIMREDLCDHAWEFHFTEDAPDYWKNFDPYWGGIGPQMHRHFHSDGSVTADADDNVWGGHECSYTIVTGIYGDGRIRENYVRINRWPRLIVSRREDWGWEMSNFVCAYSSVPDAYKEGGTGPMFNSKELLAPCD